MINYLDKETYLAKVKDARKLYKGTNWNSSRWHYHGVTVELAKKVEISKPSDVLELGSLGVQFIEGSDTMDYDKHWNLEGWQPTIQHDARDIPWPIMKGEYKLFIASRVWQHLGDKQEAAFHEAKRIAENLLLVIPLVYGKGGAVSLDQIVEWNGGNPVVYDRAGNNGIYLL